MRIALIHDYLTYFGGAERTFKTLIKLFPEAEVYTLFYDTKIKKRFFPNTEIKTSFLQKFPSVLRKKYQLLLPFLPVAIVIVPLVICGTLLILILFFILSEFGIDKLVNE